MERRVSIQLQDYIGQKYRSGSVVTKEQLVSDVNASDLPQDVKAAADGLPPGPYSKQQLLHEVAGLPVYLHPSGP